MFSLWGASPHSVEVTSMVEVVHFSSTQLLHLSTVHLTYFDCIFPLFLTFLHFLCTFLDGPGSRLPRSPKLELLGTAFPCLVIITSRSSRRDSEAKGASRASPWRCWWKKVGEGNWKHIRNIRMYVHLLPNHDFTVEHMILWDAGGGSSIKMTLCDQFLSTKLWSGCSKHQGPLGLQLLWKGWAICMWIGKSFERVQYPWHSSTWKRGVGRLFCFQAGCYLSFVGCRIMWNLYSFQQVDIVDVSPRWTFIM